MDSFHLGGNTIAIYFLSGLLKLLTCSVKNKIHYPHCPEMLVPFELITNVTMTVKELYPRSGGRG